MLTKKQKQILDYITSYITKNSYSPTREEIKEYFGLSSVATVHQHIEALILKHYLKKTANKPRSIALNKKDKKSEMVSLPLCGTIAAGSPIEAIEIPEKIKVAKAQLAKSGEHFALRVQGDSMIDEGIFNGDTVIIRKQANAENGETVVALLPDNEVTLKKIYREKNGFRLQPANPSLKPIFVKELTIQGRIVSVIRNFDELRDYSRATSIIEAEAEPQINREQTLKKWLNTIQCLDCVKGMAQLPDASIDFVITSPPYDGIRKYNGFSYDLHSAGKELYRILKNGGLAVMVIQDQTRNFGKTLTSFKTIVDWCDNIGFKLFECLIYRKYGAEGAWWNKRFRVDHEYMPIFLKGERPQYFNKEPLKIPSKHGGKTMTGGGTRLTNGIRIATRPITINPLKCRGTVWDYLTAGDGSRLKHLHPATFPDKLPYDVIQCFCPENGIVLDPFIGSGTSAIAALQLKRHFLGFDICEEYCKLARQRLEIEANFKQRNLL